MVTDCVIWRRGADAVTSGPIASLDNATILLSRRDTLPAVTRTELAALDPTEIVIIGCTAAVSAEVETELRALADLGGWAHIVCEGGPAEGTRTSSDRPACAARFYSKETTKHSCRASL